MISLLSHSQKSICWLFGPFYRLKWQISLPFDILHHRESPPPHTPAPLQPLTRSYLFELFKFYDFFHDLFKFSKTLGLAVTFKNFKNFPYFRVFLDFKEFNRHKLRPPKCVPFALFNHSSLSYVVLALSPAVTNLSNRTLIFHDFQRPTIKFYEFPSLKNEMLKFQDFPGFPWPFHNPKLTCHLWKISKLSLVKIFSQQTPKLYSPPKCLPFALFNNSSLSYIVLALTSAITNLPNTTLIFHDWRFNSMTFQAWKLKFLIFMTFQVFPDLYKIF